MGASSPGDPPIWEDTRQPCLALGTQPLQRLGELTHRGVSGKVGGQTPAPILCFCSDSRAERLEEGTFGLDDATLTLPRAAIPALPQGLCTSGNKTHPALEAKKAGHQASPGALRTQTWSAWGNGGPPASFSGAWLARPSL